MMPDEPPVTQNSSAFLPGVLASGTVNWMTPESQTDILSFVLEGQTPSLAFLSDLLFGRSRMQPTVQSSGVDTIRGIGRRKGQNVDNASNRRRGFGQFPALELGAVLRVCYNRCGIEMLGVGGIGC